MKRQLFDGENQAGFFFDSDVGLANVKIQALNRPRKRTARLPTTWMLL